MVQDLAEGPGMLSFHPPLLLPCSSLLRWKLPADGVRHFRGNQWGNATNLVLYVNCCHVSSVVMVTTRPLVGAYLFFFFAPVAPERKTAGEQGVGAYLRIALGWGRGGGS